MQTSRFLHNQLNLWIPSTNLRVKMTKDRLAALKAVSKVLVYFLIGNTIFWTILKETTGSGKCCALAQFS